MSSELLMKVGRNVIVRISVAIDSCASGCLSGYQIAHLGGG